MIFTPLIASRMLVDSTTRTWPLYLFINGHTGTQGPNSRAYPTHKQLLVLCWVHEEPFIMC